MKKIACICAVSVILLGGGCQSTPTAKGNESAYVEMVWIPQTGKRYHRNKSCSGMKNPSEATIEEAVDLGFTPCGNCY